LFCVCVGNVDSFLNYIIETEYTNKNEVGKLNSILKIQIIEKNDQESLTNIDIFNMIKRIINVFLEGSVSITENELSLEIPEEDMEDLIKTIQIINRVFKWFWLEFLSIELKYQQFIKNVTPKLKHRIPNKKNFLVLRVTTPIKHDPNIIELLANVNRGYPKLFINLYIEEILDGALIFFNDLIDFQALIDEPEGLQFGKKWLKENGFDIPHDYENLKFSEFLNQKKQIQYLVPE
jgi:hypothetical protein